MNLLLRPLIWPSFRASSGLATLRRTIQVRLDFDLGFRISDLGFLTTIDDNELNSSGFAICSLVLTKFSANFQSAFRNPHSAMVDPVAPPSPRSRDEDS